MASQAQPHAFSDVGRGGTSRWRLCVPHQTRIFSATTYMPSSQWTDGRDNLVGAAATLSGKKNQRWYLRVSPHKIIQSTSSITSTTFARQCLTPYCLGCCHETPRSKCPSLNPTPLMGSSWNGRCPIQALPLDGAAAAAATVQLGEAGLGWTKAGLVQKAGGPQSPMAAGCRTSNPTRTSWQNAAWSLVPWSQPRGGCWLRQHPPRSQRYQPLEVQR
jgi:hypothetical protein